MVRNLLSASFGQILTSSSVSILKKGFCVAYNKKILAFFALISGIAAGQAAYAGPIYNGGPVMLGTPNVNLIWYGDWSSYASTQSLVDNFVSSLGGSGWYNINSTYYNGSGQHVSNSLALAGSSNDTNGYTSGATITDQGILDIVRSAYSTIDPNGIYLVLTDPTLHQAEDHQACGWHSNSNYFASSDNVKFGWIGGLLSQTSSCSIQTANSPNSNPLGDAMVNIIAHEISETVTDPNLNAWWDSNSSSPTYGNENADMGAWTFGTTYTASNGSTANVTVGTNNYLLQQDWVTTNGTTGTGYLALNYASPVPEPDTLMLMGISLLSFAISRRRKPDLAAPICS